MQIIKHKNLFFLLSGLIIVPGIISLVMFGLLPSIDFTDGSKIELKIKNEKLKIDEFQIKNVIESEKLKNVRVQQNSENNFSVRTEAIDQKRNDQLLGVLKNKFGDVTETNFDTVGPTIGREAELNALKAVVIASLVITLYIAYTFRAVSRPVASWKFGVAAVVALLHDVLLVLGIFSILGRFLGVEVDSLFITALLTVMGFSVHDTIVVFDRIRENLKKNINNIPFEHVVNNSILETMNRSLNTSLTVILVLLALLLFGGENIKWFVIALLIGIISGTYSSIFNASPLLVAWYEFDKKRRAKK